MNKILKILLAFLGVFTAVTGICLSLCFQNSQPILLKHSAGIQTRVTGMMDAVCAGDYTGAGQQMYGTPSFGPDREAAEAVSVLYWDAFSESITYELVGECYAEGNYLIQKIRITCLDFDSITENLRTRFQTLLEQQVANAWDTSEVYDENNNFREDMVMALLYQAAEECLREDAAMVTMEVAVKLTYEQGQWWILPEKELLEAITGGVLK